MQNEIGTYTSGEKVHVSQKVEYSMDKLINRIYQFKNQAYCDKINAETGVYQLYFDIIQSRVDTMIKNLRIDSKNIITFSRNHRKDFAAVFITNTQIRNWMEKNGENKKLRSIIELFCGDGNVILKKAGDGYAVVDPLKMIITNQTAETIDQTNIIEIHNMTASQIMSYEGWDNKEEVISNDAYAGMTFSAAHKNSENTTNTPVYEIYEYTGEVTEEMYYELKGMDGGSPHKYMLAKVIFAGLTNTKTDKSRVLFCTDLEGEKISDYYEDMHFGEYKGRFWREGLYERLMDHQIRYNDIANQLSAGLEWSSKVIYTSRDQGIVENLRTDIENGEVIIADDIQQLSVRMQGLDQLIADANRILREADTISHSFEVSRGESLPSGTPFRSAMLANENAGKMYSHLRQKFAMSFKRVFKEWVLPTVIKDIKGEDIYRITGDTQMIEMFHAIAVESWYMENLVKIGPHTAEQAEAIKQEKLEELKKMDPVIENSKEIWSGVKGRLYVDITGENSDVQDQIQDLINLIGLEQDPNRVSWILDTIYRARNIPIPPTTDQTAETVEMRAEPLPA